MWSVSPKLQKIVLPIELIYIIGAEFPMEYNGVGYSIKMGCFTEVRSHSIERHNSYPTRSDLHTDLTLWPHEILMRIAPRRISILSFMDKISSFHWHTHTTWPLPDYLHIHQSRSANTSEHVIYTKKKISRPLIQVSKVCARIVQSMIH